MLEENKRKHFEKRVGGGKFYEKLKTDVTAGGPSEGDGRKENKKRGWVVRRVGGSKYKTIPKPPRILLYQVGKKEWILLCLLLLPRLLIHAWLTRQTVMEFHLGLQYITGLVAELLKISLLLRNHSQNEIWIVHFRNENFIFGRLARMFRRSWIAHYVPTYVFAFIK